MKNITDVIAKNKIRYDFEIIADLIKPNSRVIDIGCFDGELLSYLKKNNVQDVRGIEISQNEVCKAVAKGLNVIQGDAEKDLEFYPDKSFDYAILSHTLQVTKNPKEVLQEMMRISEFAIVSLPNFAHYQNRLELMFKGKMPVNKSIPFEWFETPNIHFCSIKDFINLCKILNLKIIKKIYLTEKNKLPKVLSCNNLANLFAKFGIFLITKDELAIIDVKEKILTNLSLNYRVNDQFAFSKK